MVTIRAEDGHRVTRDASWLRKGEPAIMKRPERSMASDRVEVSTTEVPIEKSMVQNSSTEPVESIVEANLVAPRRSNRESKQTKFYGIN